MAQDDPIDIIRAQASSREALDDIMVAACGVARFNEFANRWGVRGERFAKSQIEEETGRRGVVIVCSGVRGGMLY